ncbi:hypothetical protein ACHAQJ_007456 [Trichoderma viride]
MDSRPDVYVLEDMEPPPYESFTAKPDHSEHDDDDCNDKVSVPPWMMKKISKIGPHAERFRLVMKYIKRKGNIVKQRETALKLQDDILKKTIKKVEADIYKLRNTRIYLLWSIAKTKRHRLLTLFKMDDKSFAWLYYTCLSLKNVGTYEAQKMHRTETEKIQTAYRKAVIQLDEEYKTFLDSIIDGDEKATVVES